MQLDDFNSFCGGLSHTAHVVQWGGAHVWKVGGAKGKMFCIGWPEAAGLLVTFKVTPLAYDILKEQEGLIPAPYLASRGMTWIQRVTRASMDDEALRDYLRASYRLCAAALPKAVQAKLGLMGRESERA
jgi:predicted DNA-binding protein (MmcQ/YjbR family)